MADHDKGMDKGIGELLAFLQDGCDFGCECGTETAKGYFSSLTDLIAERSRLVGENMLMEQRYADALRQIDRLRERGITAHQFADANTLDAIESWMNAVTGMLGNHAMPHPNSMKDELASRRDAAVAAMRKETDNGG